VVSESVRQGGQRLTLPAPLARAMLDHSRTELPNEACGLLSGILRTGQAVAFHPARNSERSALRYNVDPDDLLRITLEIEAAGRDLVGIFHSHTRTPAVPSATDLRVAMYPDPFYVLATLADLDATPERALRAWRIRGGRSIEVALHIDGGDSTRL
jgi:[CysO sulfur-carrier protein]-S-L-cysteine hydrolase